MLTAVSSLAAAFGWTNADAATVTAAYVAGYRNVTINGYGAAGMGTFVLRDGGTSRVALCLEADVSHTTTPEAYAAVANRVVSPELDALLWWLDGQTTIDNDTAVASAALAWYYARAVRTIGPLVWSDGHRNFAEIGPLAPESWDALPRLTLDHMVGLVAGGAHLDAAERRVAELHRLAMRLAGPWQLSADDDSRAFILTGRNGPIAGHPITVTAESTGRAEFSQTVVTDASGRATIDVPAMPDGGTIRGVAQSPGTHREWDGGAIQRMATATSVTVTAEFPVGPLARHVRVVKRSSDPTIGVAGAEFELRGSGGSVIATTRSDSAGIARFDPIDPTATPGPYEVVELAAPPGLSVDATPRPVESASIHPAQPTTIEIVNHPATAALQVRKQLSVPEAGPIDRRGFRFTAIRREDGAEHQLVTGPDGTTEPALVAMGTYDICERAVPDWAIGLADGGCVEVVVGADDVASLDVAAHTPLAIDYVNVVPRPSIATSATDEADGDRTMFTSGGVVIDHVELRELVPGTTYILVGEAIAVGETTSPTGVTAEASFTATSSDHSVDLEFPIPPGEATSVVIVERLSIGARVVAVHDDLADPDQTITVIAPPTTTTTTTTTTTIPTTIAPTTVAPTTTIPTTTSTTASIATTSTTATPMTTTTVPIVTIPPLPRTGSDAGGTLLRLADLGFIVGVGLVAVAGLAPRRRHDS